MKLTILLALGTALVTLAQKPTLEPQKDWSKERTQLWLDSLVKSLSQDTKILSNTTQNLSEQPPVGTMTQAEVDAINKIELEKQQAENYRKSKQAVEEAEFIFEGMPLYHVGDEDDGPHPTRFMHQGLPYEMCRVQITRIYKGEPKLKLGTVLVITRSPEVWGEHAEQGILQVRKGKYQIMFCKKNTSTILPKEKKNDNNLELYVQENFFDVNIYHTEIYNNHGISFKNKKDFYEFMKFAKNINFNQINENEDESRKRFNPLLYTDEQKKRMIQPTKSSNQSSLRTGSILGESKITSFSPSIIRAGLNENLTIFGQGFGVSSITNSTLKIIQFINADKASETKNLDRYFSGLDSENYLFWPPIALVCNGGG